MTYPFSFPLSSTVPPCAPNTDPTAIPVSSAITPRPRIGEWKDAIARAFFGGRFENAKVGPVREALWNYDISSAYPYQMTFLPCSVTANLE